MILGYKILDILWNLRGEVFVNVSSIRRFLVSFRSTYLRRCGTLEKGVSHFLHRGFEILRCQKHETVKMRFHRQARVCHFDCVISQLKSIFLFGECPYINIPISKSCDVTQVDREVYFVFIVILRSKSSIKSQERPIRSCRESKECLFF